MGLLIFFCGLVFVAGFFVSIIFDEPICAVFTLIICIFVFMFGAIIIEGSSMTEKCVCEEAIQVETCEDCGGIIE